MGPVNGCCTAPVKFAGFYLPSLKNQGKQPHVNDECQAA